VYEDGCRLGCSAVFTDKSLQAFQRAIIRDDGGIKEDFFSVGKFLPDYMALQPRRYGHLKTGMSTVVKATRRLTYLMASPDCSGLRMKWYIRQKLLGGGGGAMIHSSQGVFMEDFPKHIHDEVCMS
jgi:hypothetical protein